MKAELKLVKALRLQLEADACDRCNGTGIIPTPHDPRDPSWGRECLRCDDLQKLISGLKLTDRQRDQLVELIDDLALEASADADI